MASKRLVDTELLSRSRSHQGTSCLLSPTARMTGATFLSRSLLRLWPHATQMLSSEATTVVRESGIRAWHQNRTRP